MIARRKGYRVAVVLPDNVTEERRQLLALFGAEIIDSPGHLGSNGAVQLAKQLVAQRPALRHALPVRQPRESRAPTRRPRPRRSSPTAPRSMSSWPASGPAGRSSGVGRRLRRHNPDVRIYAAEPLPGEHVQGLRSLDEGFIPEIFDPRVLDGKLLVSNAESIRALRDLTDEEGIFAGVSSGRGRGRGPAGRARDGRAGRSWRSSPMAAGSTSPRTSGRATSSATATIVESLNLW